MAQQPIFVRSSLSKRLFDIAFSLLALILLLPIFLIISAIILFQSSGPVFHVCKRVGQGGRIIHCLKFRTMYEGADLLLEQIIAGNPRMNAEWHAFQKLKNDPRVTPFGKFLRTTSLDELPQFWNVLKGDLSVVGPRPPSLYGPEESFLHELRGIYGEKMDSILSVKPGITGAWQVAGRSEIGLSERSQIEAEYAETRTFWKDLILIAKTIPAVLFTRGAF